MPRDLDVRLDELKSKSSKARRRRDHAREVVRREAHRLDRLIPKIRALRRRLRQREALDVSERGLRFIGRWEGFRSRCYEDVAGHATQGYGHLRHFGACTAAERGEVWDDEKALRVLRDDAEIAVRAVRDYIDVRLTQPQFDALVSFAFNCGSGALASSTLRVRLNNAEYAAVPSELARWNRAGGVPVAGLTGRRREEGKLWADGEYG